MNKKFLLLPLTAMTASVYAAEQTEFIEITPKNSKLTQDKISMIAPSIDLDGLETLIKAQPNGQDENGNELYQLFINKQHQIQALKELAKAIKSADDLKTYKIIDNQETQSIDETTILESINLTLSAQAPQITYDTQNNNFIIIPEIIEGTDYNTFKARQNNEQDISLNDIYKASNTIIPTDIKNQKLFLSDHGTKTIKVTTGQTSDDIQNAIKQLISTNDIQVTKYQKIKQTLQDTTVLPSDLKEMKFTYNDSEHIDEAAPKYKLYKAYEAQFLTIAKQKEEIAGLKKQLEDEKKQPKKTVYSQPKALKFSQAADIIQDRPTISTTLADSLLKDIYDSLALANRKAYEVPKLTLKGQQNQSQRTTVQIQTFQHSDEATQKYYQAAQTLCFGKVDSKTNKPQKEYSTQEVKTQIYDCTTGQTQTVQNISYKIAQYNQKQGCKETNQNSIHNLSKAATLLYNNGIMNYNIQATFQILIPAFPAIKGMNAKQLKETYEIK